MEKTNKGPFKNNLATMRQRHRIPQKRIAELIGHKSADQLLQYERGAKTPNLKTALKLAYIFEIPIRVMLDGYFAACREEVRRASLSSPMVAVIHGHSSGFRPLPISARMK